MQAEQVALILKKRYHLPEPKVWRKPGMLRLYYSHPYNKNEDMYIDLSNSLYIPPLSTYWVQKFNKDAQGLRKVILDDQKPSMRINLFPIISKNLEFHSYRVINDTEYFGKIIADRLTHMTPATWIYSNFRLLADRHINIDKLRMILPNLNIKDMEYLGSTNLDKYEQSLYYSTLINTHNDEKLRFESTYHVINKQPMLAVSISEKADGITIGSMVGDRTGELKGTVVKQVNTLTTERERLLGLTKRAAMKEILRNSPDSTRVFAVKVGYNQYDYPETALYQIKIIDQSNIDDLMQKYDFLGPQVTDLTHKDLFIPEPVAKRGRKVLYLKHGEIYHGPKKLSVSFKNLFVNDFLVISRGSCKKERYLIHQQNKNIGFIEIYEAPEMDVPHGYMFKLSDRNYIIKREKTLRLKLYEVDIIEALAHFPMH
ncbi:MAG: hypothetical protein INQ03_09325 [Candidatus Heimdallarchaeota archaeon]|nr:hypothetical protein [Candidatus Heimdallarchaeota archaeon]